MKRLFLTLALVLSVLSVMAADILPISNAFKGGNASSLSGSMDKEVDMGPTGFIQKVQRKRRCFNAEHLLRREQADRIYSRPPC